MSRHGQIIESILSVLSDGAPESAKEIVNSTGRSKKIVWNTLTYMWKNGVTCAQRNLSMGKMRSLKREQGFDGIPELSRAYMRKS